MTDTTILYPAIISFLLIIILIILQVVFRPYIKRRKALIDQLESADPIAISTPLDRPLHSFKSRAKRSVSNRFSIFRRVATIFILLLLIIALSFPFIDQLPQAFLSILVGSAAIITGMAARPFIENFLSGVAITSSKMVKIGDTVLLNDQYGTIEDISSTHTVVKLWDWRRFVIPNSAMINRAFINYSLYDSWQLAHVEFFVAYKTDMQRVKELAQAAARKSKHYAGIEEPSFWIMETTKETIKCWVAAWAASPLEAWELKADIRTELILQFRKEGIETHLNYHSVEAPDLSTKGAFNPKVNPR